MNARLIGRVETICAKLEQAEMMTAGDGQSLASQQLNEAKNAAMEALRTLENSSQNATAPMTRCSFCDAESGDVMLMIASAAAAICDQCVEACRDLVGEKRRKLATENTSEKATTEPDSEK